MSTTTIPMVSPGVPKPAATSPDKASSTAWIAVLAGLIGAFMAILNIQITNASLLDIEGGIGTGVDNGAWISTSYLIGEIVVIPLTALLFSLDLDKYGPGLFLLALAALPGVAASGTLFGAMTVRTAARDLLLAVVLFPLIAPTLLAAVAGTRELFGGASIAELGDYFRLMLVFDVVFTAGGLALFGTLVEG